MRKFFVVIEGDMENRVNFDTFQQASAYLNEHEFQCIELLTIKDEDYTIMACFENRGEYPLFNCKTFAHICLED